MILEKSVEIYKSQWKFFVVLALVLFAGQLFLDTVQDATAESAFSFLLGVVRWGIEMYVGLALLLVALKAADGNMLSWNSVRELLPTKVEIIKNYVLTSIVYALIVTVGTILLIVPGVIWGLMYSLAVYVVADKGSGVKESLRLSKEFTAGNKLPLLGLAIVLVLVNMVGAMLFGIGLVVTVPISMIAGAVAYRELSGTRDEAQYML